jgi:hypothetical protein
MKAITVRGLDKELAAQLAKQAQEEGKSVNQFILDVFREKLGLSKGKRFTAVSHDMDHFFGRWPEEEFRRIQGGIDSQRSIEEELWR